LAGIYIHIPYCSQACTYCDFHFSTRLQNKSKLVKALCAEISLQEDYLEGDEISSIYFGGGTPSVLSSGELDKVFKAIYDHHAVKEDAEITLEANPDDLTDEHLIMLSDSPVNRLSIGIQSFDEDDLKFMNRSHTAHQARNCVAKARQFGFDNITVDLIYAVPGRDVTHWQKQVDEALRLAVPHLSSYALTVEKETVLAHWIKKGEVNAPDDTIAQEQFFRLSESLSKAGFEHYEVSNFAQPGKRAVHNSSYWTGESYLGIGPSAHSFNGSSRQWNVSNNHLYMNAIESEELFFDKETLSLADRFNEAVMTNLRRKEGLELAAVDQQFGAEFGQFLAEESEKLLKSGKLQQSQGRLFIPLEQRFFSDGIASELFYI